MAAQSPPLDQTAAYQAASGQTRAQLLAYATALWVGLGNYRDKDIDRFIAALVPRVIAGQLAIANLTSVYLAKTARTTVAATPPGPQGNALAPARNLIAPRSPVRPHPTRAIRSVKPVPVDTKLVTNGRGVPHAEVYRRPAIEMYSALKKGVPYPQAVQRGQTRLNSLVSTDLQMAKVRQADVSLEASGAKYFRRVLVGEYNCAKCIITSTRRYKVGNLLPGHPGCNCGVAEVNESDPPMVLDPDLLKQTHEQVELFAKMSNDSAKGYQDIIVTHMHGEIGPVLSWRNQHFTGPADIH